MPRLLAAGWSENNEFSTYLDFVHKVSFYKENIVMNIAFLTNQYPHIHSGGIGTNIRNLARGLVDNGNNVTILGLGKPIEFDDCGVNVKFLSPTSVPRMGWLLNRMSLEREIKYLIDTKSIDVIEAPDGGGITAGMRLPCPVLIKCHGSSTFFSHLLNDKLRPSVFYSEKLALKNATGIAAVSQFAADTTRRVFKLKKHIDVIHNCIDLKLFQPSPFELVENDTILYFGAIVRKKGVLDLCQIFSNVVSKYPKAKLILIGKDIVDKKTGCNSTWAMCQDILTNEARKRVEYLGPQPYDKMQAYIQKAALCIFPSYAEALPLAWLEAMACAKPIIAYDIGWASEIIVNDTSGILIPRGDIDAFADAIVHSLQNSNLREKISKMARIRIEDNFSVEKIVDKSTQWYQSFLD